MTTPAPGLWSSDTPATLQASRHRDTGARHFPALPAHSPLAAQYDTVPVRGAGTVYSFTVIHPAPKTGLPPYALGYVDLDGPLRVFGRLEGKERPAIGDRYAPVADATFGYVFQAEQD
ncbi:Zn-ribbon domain-containing OB-fold protein [Cupriavidus agavae]|uniref:ChsH2 C-terminal OB-fold domain-containing protein n=1 Tax=Cupriavidus agavae TaxID=1001822 RepID=A0A4V2FF26_9BURK|nr:OB-fold domain-containing protein [Cupriavidus agavae]RZT31809.1 hypothetical protein EV147_4309 [Cupriavidus agavae]